MLVNIARNKLLVNKNRFSARARKAEVSTAPRCKHCGGLLRVSGELNACIMCSREAGHVCATCAYAGPGDHAVTSKKKSA